MKEKIKEIIAGVLNLPLDQIKDSDSTQSISKWDSLNHMNIIFAIEEQLGITFDDEEIMTLNSIEKITDSASRHKA